jgi:hypothetical protein
LESGQSSYPELQLSPTSTKWIQESYVLGFLEKHTNTLKEASALSIYKMQVAAEKKKT